MLQQHQDDGLMLRYALNASPTLVWPSLSGLASKSNVPWRPTFDLCWPTATTGPQSQSQALQSLLVQRANQAHCVAAELQACLAAESSLCCWLMPRVCSKYEKCMANMTAPRSSTAATVIASASILDSNRFLSCDLTPFQGGRVQAR